MFTFVIRTPMLLVCCATLGCGSKHENKDATAEGTTVLEWDLGQSDKPALKTAALEDKKSFDVVQVMEPTDNSKVTLELHIEVATANYQVDGLARTARVPVRIKAAVRDGNNLTFHDGTCVGPKVTDTSTAVDCSIRTDRPGLEGGVFFGVLGDGRVEPGRMVLPVTKSK